MYTKLIRFIGRTGTYLYEWSRKQELKHFMNLVPPPNGRNYTVERVWAHYYPGVHPDTLTCGFSGISEGSKLPDATERLD